MALDSRHTGELDRQGWGQVRTFKGPEKVGAAAARILMRHHGYRYYAWEYKEGRFRYFEHPVNLRREEAYEGKYIIQTEEKNLSAQEVVQIYKELSDVERACGPTSL